MYNDTVWLFGIFIILVLFAVIAFAYFVIKPLQTALAIRKAK
jgi:tellurite resistance protein TehA-like permease